jgi:hypothetical protein
MSVPTVLDLVTEMKRKVSWRRPRSKNWAVEPQDEKEYTRALAYIPEFSCIFLPFQLLCYSRLHCDISFKFDFNNIIVSMGVPRHSRPRPLIQFRNRFYTEGRTLWTNDQSVARPLHAHRHPCIVRAANVIDAGSNND